MSTAMNSQRLSEDSGYMETFESRVIQDYTEFDIEDSVDNIQQYKPLLDIMDQKEYRLPSEGGSLFTSFVRL